MVSTPSVSVDILLSTWNGERFLVPLLDSLLAQSCLDWRLIWRDDGSSDNSVIVMQQWQQQQQPQKVKRLNNSGQHLGVIKSHNALVAASGADYLLLCDQDDVWFPQKISKLLSTIQTLEAECGEDKALLVHADLSVTDTNLRVLHPSFWRYQHLNIRQNKQAYLLKNVVTACACLFNKSAAELAFPVPQEARMHDHWLALVVATLGEIAVCDKALMYYRQHPKNTVGAFAKFDLSRFNHWSQYVKRIRRTTLAKSEQGEALLQRFEPHLNREDKRRIQALTQLNSSSFFKRLQLVSKYQLSSDGFVSFIAIIVFSGQ